MKLINPTDDELNAAFAEKVAGWTDVRYEEGENVDIDARVLYPWEGMAGSPPDGQERRLVPPFTRSMDAVLPWLNAPGWLWHISNDEIHTDKPFTACVHRGLAEASASDTNAPRACVIALLRANGVEVVCP